MLNRILLVAMTASIMVGCQRSISTIDESFPLKISFVHKVGNQMMQLGSSYQNVFGESYTLNHFKYYVSNISLTAADAGKLNLQEYHLVDEANPATKSFTVTLPSNRFNAFAFVLGVDSASNVSGVQSGDLDAAKGMFWTWNTGYIMAKLEGTSPVSTAPANSLSWHIGGFRTGENTIRTIELAFPAGTILQLSKDNTTEIVIEADADKWFQGVHDMRIASNPLCHSPGALAVKFADNYSRMFKIVAIKN